MRSMSSIERTVPQPMVPTLESDDSRFTCCQHRRFECGFDGLKARVTKNTFTCCHCCLWRDCLVSFERFAFSLLICDLRALTSAITSLRSPPFEGHSERSDSGG